MTNLNGVDLLRLRATSISAYSDCLLTCQLLKQLYKVVQSCTEFTKLYRVYKVVQRQRRKLPPLMTQQWRSQDEEVDRALMGEVHAVNILSR